MNRRGDTIVEVMVVLAVLGLAISISYATASRSLLDARQAQEDSIASELVQSQIEELRTLTQPASWANITPSGQLYCVYPSGGSSYAVQSIPATATVGNYPSNCTSDNQLYDISVTYTGNPSSYDYANPSTFKVMAIWPDVEGQGDDTVTLTYRLYEQP